ncbi:MAG: hypothetical protein HYT88_04000 [Candidatus Omnitrophica bacterium]|nr:hypothetical protein [Candidatus Omnitrophota bacterium]
MIPVETARALNADVQDRNVELEAAWKSESAWQAALHGRASSLSDDNQRFTGVVEISKRLLKLLPAAELIYRFTADDTQVISPNYYSPQLLMLHQLGVHYSLQPWRWLGLSVRYLPGIGDEDGSDPRFIQAFELHAPFKRHDRIWLEPTFFARDPERGRILRLRSGFGPELQSKDRRPSRRTSPSPHLSQPPQAALREAQNPSGSRQVGGPPHTSSKQRTIAAVGSGVWGPVEASPAADFSPFFIKPSSLNRHLYVMLFVDTAMPPCSTMRQQRILRLHQ